MVKLTNNRNASQQDCQHLTDGKLENSVIERERAEVLTEVLRETEMCDVTPYRLVSECRIWEGHAAIIY